MPSLESLRSSTHSVSNMLIRVDGDSDRVELYWHVFDRELSQDGPADYDYVAGGHYLDRFEQRGGDWRILTRVLVRDCYQVIEGTGDWTKYPRPQEGPHGSGKKTDLVRALFGTLRPRDNPCAAIAKYLGHPNTASHATDLGGPIREPTATDSERCEALSGDRRCS